MSTDVSCREVKPHLQSLLAKQERTRDSLKSVLQSLCTELNTVAVLVLSTGNAERAGVVVKGMNLRDGVENGLPDLCSLPKRLTVIITAKDYSSGVSKRSFMRCCYTVCGM